jgi:hypothetical protein
MYTVRKAPERIMNNNLLFPCFHTVRNISYNSFTVLGIFLSVPAAKILLNISYFFIQHPDSIFRKLLKTSSLDVKICSTTKNTFCSLLVLVTYKKVCNDLWNLQHNNPWSPWVISKKVKTVNGLISQVVFNQEVTRRCRQFWLTNSALVN